MHVITPEEFDPSVIIKSGQCFRAKEVSFQTYRFITGKRVLFMKRISRRRYDISCGRYAWIHTWRPYFDFTSDYASFRRLIPQNDLFLKQAAETGKGMRILRQNAWETLITFILSQRKTIPAISSAAESLSRLAGCEIPCDPAYSETPLYAFPTAQALSHRSLDDLRRCGLGYRAPYVHETAKRIDQDKTFLSDIAALDDRNLIAALQTLPGVGVKVASCVALFAYHRLSVAPVDVWIQTVIDDRYHGISPFPSYGKNAGLFQQYMFIHIRNMSKGKI